MDWDGGHAGLAAAASGATRRGSWAPGAPDRGSRQRRDGSQLAHSSPPKMAPRPRRWQEEVEGPEKALDWRPGWHQRPNHRPEARFGGAARPDRGCPCLHLQPEATHASFHREVTHSPRSHATLLERHRDLDWIYWNWQVTAGQLNALSTGKENPKTAFTFLRACESNC